MEYSKQIKKAVKHFWETREGQLARQGDLGRSDQGARGAVTGGKQLDGFVDLCTRIANEAGIPQQSVYCNTRLELPGYYRPEKKWDLVIVHEDNLLAAIEFKSHIGPSFGNNFNNRTEEAIGNAQDNWTAYREGAFSTNVRPWLGFLMLLEEAPRSVSPVAVREPHFEVFPEFKSSSYAERYVILMTKLIRERLYDSASLLLSSRVKKAGNYREPAVDLTFDSFATALHSHLVQALRAQ